LWYAPIKAYLSLVTVLMYRYRSRKSYLWVSETTTPRSSSSMLISSLGLKDSTGRKVRFGSWISTRASLHLIYVMVSIPMMPGTQKCRTSGIQLLSRLLRPRRRTRVRKGGLSLRLKHPGYMERVDKERDVRVRKGNCVHKGIHKQYRYDVSDFSSPAHKSDLIVVLLHRSMQVFLLHCGNSMLRT
jgi:hypothetical protein